MNLKHLGAQSPDAEMLSVLLMGWALHYSGSQMFKVE